MKLIQIRFREEILKMPMLPYLGRDDAIEILEGIVQDIKDGCIDHPNWVR